MIRPLLSSQKNPCSEVPSFCFRQFPQLKHMSIPQLSWLLRSALQGDSHLLFRDQDVQVLLPELSGGIISGEQGQSAHLNLYFSSHFETAGFTGEGEVKDRDFLQGDRTRDNGFKVKDSRF